MSPLVGHMIRTHLILYKTSTETLGPPQKFLEIWSYQKYPQVNFLGCTVDKNPPANMRDRGSTPDSGKFHMPQNN